MQSTVQTTWPSNSQLLVRTVVFVPPAATNLRIMVSVDNDIIGVFFDGQALTNTLISHEGCPIQDEFRFDVPSSLMTPGDKLVAFHVQDRGVESFFDARILAELPLLAKSKCSDTNLVTVPCTELNDYIRDCGVICPNGVSLPGKGGCTAGPINSNYQYSIDFGAGLDFGERTCASAMVTVHWSAPVQSSVIDYQPTACCAKECADKVAEVTRQLEAHEAEHRTNCEAAVAEANRVWAARLITDCGNDRRSATRRFNLQFAAARQATQKTIAAECFTREPTQPRLIDCGKCIPPKPGQSCVNGQCVQGPCSQSSRCPNAVDCSQRGKMCLCLGTVEGDIRCGASGGRDFCLTAVPCVTSDACERFKGQGWFCQQPGTGCCGCARLPNGAVTCGDTGVCVPPC